jgi:hypothetical protein
MKSLSEIYIKKETIETILKALNAKTGKDAEGVKITISLGGEPNQWGQDVTAFVSQSKEDREAKKKKFYIGNGKTFWKEEVAPAPKKNNPPSDSDPFAPETATDNDDQLPF